MARGQRNVTVTEHHVGSDVVVDITRWRNANATAFIAVVARGPGGVKRWEAKSQGPSAGGYSKPVQAAERVYDKITGVPFTSWGSEGLEEIARAAAEKVRSKSNPRYRRTKMSRRRRNPSDEQRELELYIVNDYDLYKGQCGSIITNLAKKMRKGVYDHAKAAKLWTYLADSGAQKYTKEYDTSRPSTSYGAFSKADRVAVGKSLADYYLDAVKEAAGEKSNPRRTAAQKYRVGGSRRLCTYAAALAKASEIHRRTGIIVGVEAATKSNPRYRRTKMARRKKSRRTSTRRAKGYKGGVRVVRFKVRGRVKIVRFHKPGTKAGKRGSAAKRAAGKRLAKKYGFFRKGAAIYQKRPGKKSKLIRRL